MKIKQWKLLKPFMKKEKDTHGAARPKSLLHYFFSL